MYRVLSFGSRFTVLISVIALTAVSGLTQNREKYIISAKAGGVNTVSGYVTVLDHLTGVQRALNFRDNLEPGDVVMTGSDGRAEVLLNPGTYLRVAENSEFSFDDTSLEKLSLRLTKGTAIVEATGDDDVELFATIATPQTRISILKRGIYRINVLASNTTEVVVHKGRAILNDDQAKLVKDGKKAIVTGNGFELAKAEKEKDALDIWSRERAEALAKINHRVSGTALANAFSGITGDPWYNRWYFRTSFLSPGAGLWYYDSLFGCYTFLPPYAGGGSPYGFGYTGWPIGYAWGNYWRGSIPTRRIVNSYVPATGTAVNRVLPPRPIRSTITAADVRNSGFERSNGPRRVVGDRPTTNTFNSGGGFPTRDNGMRGGTGTTSSPRPTSNETRGPERMPVSAPPRESSPRRP
jgi:hypothetical protein